MFVNEPRPREGVKNEYIIRQRSIDYTHRLPGGNPVIGKCLIYYLGMPISYYTVFCVTTQIRRLESSSNRPCNIIHLVNNNIFLVI